MVRWETNLSEGATGDTLPTNGYVWLTNVKDVVNAFGKQFYSYRGIQCWFHFPYTSYSTNKSVEFRWEHYSDVGEVRALVQNMTSTYQYVVVFQYTKITD